MAWTVFLYRVKIHPGKECDFVVKGVNGILKRFDGCGVKDAVNLFPMIVALSVDIIIVGADRLKLA
jgi:hypothetical protein